MNARTLTALALAGALFVACGGRTFDSNGQHSGSSSGGSSGGSSGASSGSSGGSSGASSGSSGASSGSSSGGTSSGSSSGTAPACVHVDPTSYDTSCNTVQDCVIIQAFDVCDGYCADCGYTPISAADESRYQAAIASIVPGKCSCGVGSPPACINHVCRQEGPDAGPPDAGTCVFVDVTKYDQSCKVDSDCIDISAGNLCSDQCLCGGATINADGQAEYNAQISQLGTGIACPCPFLGTPRCIQSTCTLCGFGPNQPPGCPDAG